jgi:hypothetical protein
VIWVVVVVVVIAGRYYYYYSSAMFPSRVITRVFHASSA